MKFIRELLIGIIGNIISTIILAVVGAVSIFFSLNSNLSTSQASVVGIYFFIIIVAVHILFTQEKSQIYPTTKFYRYKSRFRKIIFIIFILSTILVLLFLRPSPPFTIPDLEIKIVNNVSQDVIISNRAEFFLTYPETPLSDIMVASGRIELYKISDKTFRKTELVVPANGELVVYAHISNPLNYRSLLEMGDTNMILTIYQGNGKIISKQGIPFDRYTLGNYYIVLETHK